MITDTVERVPAWALIGGIIVGWPIILGIIVLVLFTLFVPGI